MVAVQRLGSSRAHHYRAVARRTRCDTSMGTPRDEGGGGPSCGLSVTVGGVSSLVYSRRNRLKKKESSPFLTVTSTVARSATWVTRVAMQGGVK